MKTTAPNHYATTGLASPSPIPEAQIAEAGGQLVAPEPPVPTPAPPTTTAPGLSELIPLFRVVPPRDLSIKEVDRIRREEIGPDSVALVYDVSPPGLSPQELSDELARFPDVILCDHHNGAAPSKEVAGREVTGAEIVAETLQRLWSEGLLKRADGTMLTLIGITHSMNIDPDAIVCRLLINSFPNSSLRETVWGKENLPDLIAAARIGDTTLFGGLDIKHCTYEQLSRAEKLTLTMLHLINSEKLSLVTENCLDTALLRKHAFEKFQAELPQERSAANESRRNFLKATASPEGLRDWLNKKGMQPEELVKKDRETIRADAISKAFQSSTQRPDCEASIKETLVQKWASRSDIRSVFCGPSASFTATALNRFFQNVERNLLKAINERDLYQNEVRQFLADLKSLRNKATTHSSTIGEKLTITTLQDRLDFNPERNQLTPRFPIYDWLREAAAAFGEPWLHILDRKGQPVMSARFPKSNEERPHIDLAKPEIVDELKALELAGFERAQREGKTAEGEKPAQFVIKPNLWLPLGRVHFSTNDLVELVKKHYDQIVSTALPKDPNAQPEYPTVRCGEETVPFSGSYHFERARRAVLSRSTVKEIPGDNPTDGRAFS